jgi:predicted TIM-barrel fold metal-dependent hydrolase
MRPLPYEYETLYKRTDTRVDVHTHLFTAQDVPSGFFGSELPISKYWFTNFIKGVVEVGGWFAPNSGLDYTADFLRCMENDPGSMIDEFFSNYYASSYNWVMCVHPMDMTNSIWGSKGESYEKQIQTLLMLVSTRKSKVIPFLCLNPRNPAMKYMWDTYMSNGSSVGLAWGIKLYPALGYDPADPQLIPIYAECERLGIPIMSHCSSGGIYTSYYKNLVVKRVDEQGVVHTDTLSFSQASGASYLSRPERWVPVLAQFPKLKLCLAHWGAMDSEWVVGIQNLQHKYNNVISDISYTLATHIDGVITMLKDPFALSRTAWGTDWYMSTLESPESSEINIARSLIGDERVRILAGINAKQYLFGPIL